MTPAGLPHSEIPGSQVVCTSPRLIAAYHVLLRFPEPRHPPYALILLDFYFRLPANTLLNSAHPLSRNRSFFPPSWKNGTCQRSTGSGRRSFKISRSSPGTSIAALPTSLPSKPTACPKQARHQAARPGQRSYSTISSRAASLLGPPRHRVNPAAQVPKTKAVCLKFVKRSAPARPPQVPSRPIGAAIAAGGEYRDRTGDLLLAKQALSQLS